MKKRLAPSALALSCGAALALVTGCAAHFRPQPAHTSPQNNGQPRGAAQATAVPGAQAGRPEVTAVDETALKALLGESAGRGRPMLVNFWATWCVPCREEFPDLVQIDADYRARGLDFVTVSLDDPSEAASAVAAFLGEMRAGAIPAYLLNATDPDVAINAIDPAWRGELPATFLYDRAGRLAFKHTGRVKPAELRVALEAALKAE